MKTYCDGMLSVSVTKTKTAKKHKKILDFNPEVVVETWMTDLMSAYNGNSVFQFDTNNELTMLYTLGMYGTIKIQVRSKDDLDKLLACRWLELYVHGMYSYTLEQLLFPCIEREDST